MNDNQAILSIKGKEAPLFAAALTVVLSDRHDGKAFLKPNGFGAEGFGASARVSLAESGRVAAPASGETLSWTLSVRGEAAGRIACETRTEGELDVSGAGKFDAGAIIERKEDGSFAPSAAMTAFVYGKILPALRGGFDRELDDAVAMLYSTVEELHPWLTGRTFSERAGACARTFRELLAKDPDRRLLGAVDRLLAERVEEWALREPENTAAFRAAPDTFGADVIGYDTERIDKIDRENISKRRWSAVFTRICVAILFLLPVAGCILGLFYFNWFSD
ncbi:MAG: hypothetical protein K6F50_05815 [Kiritimatiellae bacterium]|nr:hypothetical protein [Kiritimatiellia bacterium]